MPLFRSGAYRNDGESISVGERAGQVGSLLATGPGVALNLLGVPGSPTNYVAGELEIGGYGTGSLDLLSGGILRVQNFEVAQGNTGRGTVTISGGGRIYSVAGIGTAPGYLGVDIGINAGAVGSVTVTGQGSILESSGGAGRIRAGRYGSGTLDILGGADARAFFLDIGVNNGGRGTVTVDGAGSRILVSDVFGGFDTDPGEAGFARLGRAAGSYGSLTVRGGGTVDIQNNPTGNFDLPQLVVGQNTGARGRLVVEGAGSSLNIAMTGAATDAFNPGNGYYYGPRLRLGSDGGTGDVVVRRGGAITVTGEDAEVRIGERPAEGAATVRSTLTLESGGRLTVAALGTQYRSRVDVGFDAGSDGALVVRGAGSLLTVASDNIDNIRSDGYTAYGAVLTVGRLGTGLLRVDRGGDVVIDCNDDIRGGLSIAPGSYAGGIAARGTVLVTGAGSSLTVRAQDGATTLTSGQIHVGYYAQSTGALTIADGALVSNTDGFATTRVAISAGSAGEVTVTGDRSVFRAGALLSVGNQIDFSGVGVEQPLPVIGATGGVGRLMIGPGGLVEAGRTVIGAGSTLALGGTLRGDVEVRGEFAPVVELGSAIDGDLTLTATAVWRADLTLAADEAVGRVAVGGAAVVGGDFDLSVAAAARYGLGQRLVILQAASLGPVDQALAGTDFRLVSAGGRLMLEAVASRGGFSLDRSDALLNDIIVTSDAGAVRVRLGDLRGEVAVGVDLIDGSDRADRFVAADGLTRAMTIVAGAGDDIVQTTGGDQLVLGGQGNDRITTRQGDDRVQGGLGNDVIVTGLGNDTVQGGDGIDSILAGLGADSLDGGALADRIDGGGGNDTIAGGDGFDRIEGGSGNDRLAGGLGRDTFVFRAGFQEDRIADFIATSEVLDFSLHTGVDDFGDLRVTQVGADTVITDGAGGRIVLVGVTAAQIDASDFLF